MTAADDRYNGKDYAGACQPWRRTLDLFMQLDKRGELTGTDRNNSMAEMKSFFAKACDNGPPRAGLGPEI